MGQNFGSKGALEVASLRRDYELSLYWAQSPGSKTEPVLAKADPHQPCFCGNVFKAG